jgi:hypothetical protein
MANVARKVARNTFVKYTYFELDSVFPSVLKIFLLLIILLFSVNNTK